MNHFEIFQRMLDAATSNPGSVVDVPIEHLGGFSALRVCGDGKCLWYSITSAALIDQDIPISEISDLDATGELRRVARKLRVAICDELWDNVSEDFKAPYKDFWAPGEEGTEGAHTPLSYIQLLRRGEIFGGELEIFAAASLLKRGIAVVNVPCGAIARTAHLVSIQPPIISVDTPPLLLLRSGLHFDALYPSAPCSKLPSTCQQSSCG